MKVKLSKVLALLLACVMIFTTLPLMAFASDDAATYTVSYGAPAIPMNEMTKVNLADISVEMERGTVVSGADITWASAEQEGIEFDAAAKTVFAKTVGRYKLTATAAGVTKNIWVLVNNAESTIVQYRAYLYDADGNLVEKKDISRFINRYTNYYDVPDNDTYSVTFTGTGAKVVITAYDDWAAYLDHSKYPTLAVDVNF